MKRIFAAILLILAASLAKAEPNNKPILHIGLTRNYYVSPQTHTFPALDTNNAFTGNETHSGIETFTGTMTFTNHNQMYWAGPGATPTIDQAVANCAAPPVPCFVTISPGYTGPESANLTTTSTGYKVYAGANSVTIEDLRAGDSGAGTPTGTPLYPITYGGRSDGELVRESVNNWCSSPSDSCVGFADYVWFQGVFPSNGGAIMGSSSLAVLHDAVTVGTSTAPVVGLDAETWLDSTSQDRPIPYVTGISSQVRINRNPSTGRATIASAFHAQPCVDIVVGLINTCYGFDADSAQAGAQGNYGFHSASGGFLSEINTAFDFTDAGNTITTTSMVTTTATYNTSGVCVFFTGQKVLIGSVLTVSGGDYNGIYTVLAPGCNGGSSFTVTLPFSGLAASSGGTAKGIHKGTQWLSSDSSVSYAPMVDSVGWKWNRNTGVTQCQLNNTGFFCGGSLGALGGSGNAFLGGVGTEFAGAYLRESGAPSGAASDTVFGADPTTHTLLYNSNNNGNFAFTGAWQCTNVTPVTVNANVATDQNLMACTIPAGTLNRVGRTLRINVAGIFSTPAATTETLTLKTKLCTVSGCGSGTVITPISLTTISAALTATNFGVNLEGLSTTQTAGASSAYEANGNLFIDLLAATADSVYTTANTATVGTIDSTGQLFLQVTVAFSSASASNSFTERKLVLETIN